MLIVLRALIYATLFVGTLLFLLPFQILYWSGAARPVAFGLAQWAGFAVGWPAWDWRWAAC